MIRLRFLALAALLSLGFTACFDTTGTQYATVENTSFAPALGVDLANSTKTDVGVYFRDITVGTGAGLVAGQDAYYYYRAYLSSGVEIDSLLAPAQPAVLQPGNGSVIPGFEIGLQGMKVGGRRQIIVPPNLAYGLGDLKDPNGNVVIPGNSVLVFDVQLVNADGSSTP